jgi:Ca2+-binding RTX toxin-like protein
VPTCPDPISARIRSRRPHAHALARMLGVGGVALLGLWALASDADAAPATVSAAIKSGELRVTGTGGADAITVRLRATDAGVVEIDVGSDGSANFSFDRSRFTRITVNGGAGSDLLTLQPSNDVFTATETTTLNGDDGNDTLLGGNGPEKLNGGAGADLIDGNFGSDTVQMGGGNDTFRWDPGDVSDIIDGGDGADRLVFNGAGVAEAFALTASGDHARLTRNIASVVTDLDRLETIELRAAGGADTLSVANLAATDLRTVDIDMAASGGGDDLQPDALIVPPAVTVSSEGTAGVVDGLGPTLRVLNAGTTDRIQVAGTTGSDTLRVAGTPGIDSVYAMAAGSEVAVDGATGSVLTYLSAVENLDVQLGDGDDRFGAIGNLASLITLAVDGGSGADTLAGGNGADLLVGGAGADSIDGNAGTDTVQGGTEADTFQWDPGDASDVIDGGDGSDRLLFNGSNTAEAFDIASSGDHARLTRNIASVVTDLDRVETVELHMLGSADTLSVSDLSATDVRAVDTDLGAFGGGDDLQVDAVNVAAAVTVTSEGAAGVIDVPGARVRVLNGSLTDRINVLGAAGSDVLNVVGTGGADTVTATSAGTEVAIDGATGTMLTFATSVEAIDIDLGGGDDRFSAVGNLASLTALDVNGGAGNDTLLGGNGMDVLDGASGADFVDGNQGTDSISGGADGDTFQWDPGDGNDVLVGGDGVDGLIFNGSGADETFDVSAIGDHAHIARNIGAISLDLDEIEAVDLRSFGGADWTAIHDLASTDLTTVTADLAAVGGVDDGRIDSVVTRSGVIVREDGSAGLIDGLGAQVRVVNGAATDRINIIGGPDADVVTVAGSDAADIVTAVAAGTEAAVDGASGSVLTYLTAVEVLDVELGGGDDQFSAVGNLAALVSLDVNGGPGADTLLGGNGADVLDGGPGTDFIDGNQGIDTMLGDADDDVFQWDPGDGNDVIEGGDGADRMVFNGSSANEIVQLSANANRVVLTRNIASIVLDLAAIETVEVRALAGSDLITINDLSSAGVVQVATDLRSFTLGDDVQVDDVVLNATAGDDMISVLADGPAVLVDGLQTSVRITPANPTQDRLTVNGLDGDDDIQSAPEAHGLMTLVLLP